MRFSKKKVNNEVYLFDERACLSMGIPKDKKPLCKVVEVDRGDIHVVPVGEEYKVNVHSTWIPITSVLPALLVDTICYNFSMSILREDIPPFGKRGDKVEINENNFINVNDEIFLDMNEFRELI